MNVSAVPRMHRLEKIWKFARSTAGPCIAHDDPNGPSELSLDGAHQAV